MPWVYCHKSGGTHKAFWIMVEWIMTGIMGPDGYSTLIFMGSDGNGGWEWGLIIILRAHVILGYFI